MINVLLLLGNGVGCICVVITDDPGGSAGGNSNGIADGADDTFFRPTLDCCVIIKMLMW